MCSQCMELWWACESNDLVQFEKLLDEFPHIDLNFQNENGVSLLHTSSYHSSNDVLGLLLRKKTIYIEILDENGSTPFYSACANNNVKGAKELHFHGCNVNTKNDFGISPFDIALKRDHHKICSWLESLDDFVDTSVVHHEECVHGWACLICTKKNLSHVETCVVCGRQKPQTAKEETKIEEGTAEWEDDDSEDNNINNKKNNNNNDDEG